MHSRLSSWPAVPEAGEDAAGQLGEVAVLLDGAGVPRRFRAGCEHGVAWYARTTAAALLARAQDRDRTLQEALAGAIREVSALHEDDCDLEAGGPSATVVVVRWDASRVEYLVLADSSLLIRTADGSVRRLTDPRVDEVVREESAASAVERRRNAPGGFWVARHEPEAADHAVRGEVPREEVRALHLVSDGVTRAIDLLGLHDETSLVAALESDHRGVLDAVRAAERSLEEERRPRKMHDDATVLTVLLS